MTAEATDEEVVEDADLGLVGTLAAAVAVGAGLVIPARIGAAALLVAVACVQLVLAGVWVLGTVPPGRRGAFVIAALASAGADVSASVWPDGRLGTLLPVLGLAVPAMFAHQLLRGAARVQVVSSLAATALLVLAEVGLAALLQLRHEFGTDAGGTVTAAVCAAVAGALVIGCLADLLLPAPRFDATVPRGLFALVAATGLGGAVGYLLLKGEEQFGAGRGTFTGAALGALAGLLAVATAFVVHTTPRPAGALGRGLRPLLGAVLPVAVVAPAAFLLCLAIRT